MLSIKRRLSRLAWLVPLIVVPLPIMWAVGWFLVRPVQRDVGLAPVDLPAQNVQIRDNDGSPVRGWFVPGARHDGGVLLLHGVRADRRSMIGRARFLHDAGYSVLMIDFQASGESPGDAITFGYREAEDVKASLRYLHHELPRQRIGIIGTSMGGAAAIFAEPNREVDAMVLEQVYPTLSQALDDRLTIYLGFIGRWLTPFMLATLHWHEPVYPEQLRPMDHVGHLMMPKLFIAGDADRHTTLTESYAMFNAADAPKELWVIHGAEHVDLCRYAGEAYTSHVLNFFNIHLRGRESNQSTSAW